MGNPKHTNGYDRGGDRPVARIIDQVSRMDEEKGRTTPGGLHRPYSYYVGEKFSAVSLKF
jgi:hypothetical protein